MENKLKRNFFNKNIKAVYFSHDSNARNDEKMLQLRVKYGWEGYGQFWAIIEHISSTKNYKLKKDFISGLAFDLKIEIKKLNEFIDYCIQIELLKSNDRYFWSQSLLNRMKHLDRYRKQLSVNGTSGANKRWGKELNSNDESHLSKAINPVDERFLTVEIDND